MAGELAASSAAVGRVNTQEKVGCRCTTVKGIEAEADAIKFISSSSSRCSSSSPSSPSRCCLTARPVDAQKARAVDDFILCCPLLLHALAALAEDDGMPLAMLVRVS